MKGKLTVIFEAQGQPPATMMDKVEVELLTFNWTADWQEIVSNPLMAAALAGAPPDRLPPPGEQVAYHHTGAEIDIDYRIRALGKGHMTKFQPRYR